MRLAPIYEEFNRNNTRPPEEFKDWALLTKASEVLKKGDRVWYSGSGCYRTLTVYSGSGMTIAEYRKSGWAGNEFCFGIWRPR